VNVTLTVAGKTVMGVHVLPLREQVQLQEPDNAVPPTPVLATPGVIMDTFAPAAYTADPLAMEEAVGGVVIVAAMGVTLAARLVTTEL
jgi:hypothetical protein